jgi:hypothetical protein
MLTCLKLMFVVLRTPKNDKEKTPKEKLSLGVLAN